jgi:hypothetical protein
MDMQFLLDESSFPKDSKTSQSFSNPDVNDEHPTKRTSMPNILNDISSSAPPATSNPVLPPISSVLKEAAAAESRPNPPYFPSARTRMSIPFLLNGPNLPPVFYARTEAPTAQLVLNTPYQLQPAWDPRMTIDSILNTRDQPQPARDPRMTIDYILNAPDQSPPTPDARMLIEDIPNGPNSSTSPIRAVDINDLSGNIQ